MPGNRHRGNSTDYACGKYSNHFLDGYAVIWVSVANRVS